MTTDTDDSAINQEPTTPAAGDATDAPPAEAAAAEKPARAKTARKKSTAATPAPEPEPPIPLSLVIPPQGPEAGFELDDDPVHNPVPTIEPETYVAEVFAAHRSEFVMAKAEADLIVFGSEQLEALQKQLEALPEDQRPIPVLVDLTTPEGLAKAQEQQLRFSDQRKATVRTRVRYKEPFLRLGQKIDAHSKALVGDISGYEEKFAQAVKGEQERRDAEKAKLVQAELARRAALTQRVEDIRAMMVQAMGQSAAQVRALIATLDELVIDDSFAEYGELAGQAKADTQKVLAAALAAAQKTEGDMAELARFRAQYGALPAVPAMPAPEWVEPEDDEPADAGQPATAGVLLAARSPVDRGLALALLTCYRCLTGQSSDTAGAIRAAERMLHHAGFTECELRLPATTA